MSQDSSDGEEFLKDIQSIRTTVKPAASPTLGGDATYGWVLHAFSKPTTKESQAPRTRILALRVPRDASDPKTPKYDLAKTVVGVKWTPSKLASIWTPARISLCCAESDASGLPSEISAHGALLSLGGRYEDLLLEPVLDIKEAESEAREAAWLVR